MHHPGRRSEDGILIQMCPGTENRRNAGRSVFTLCFDEEVRAKPPDTQEALRRLRLFNRKAAELGGLSFPSKAFHEDAGVSVQMEGCNVHTEKIGADRESTAAFVLTLRLFLQRKDEIEVHQIESLYRGMPVADEDKYWVTENLKELDAYLDGGDVVKIVVDGVLVTNRTILETFLYGDLAHVNAEKRSTYEKWKAGPMWLLLESKFEQIVGEVMEFVFWLARMNDESIRGLEASNEAT